MSSNNIRVAIVGATGQTGSVIVKALLESTSPSFKITAITRPSSIHKPAFKELAQRGVEVVAAELKGPEDDLKATLVGVDIVISAIYGGSVMDEIPLINASKSAGVKRYLPCFFATVEPPKGAVKLRDMKEDVLNHIKYIHLPYTVIDVGWWYQVIVPRLPSGRIDYAVVDVTDGIAGEGNVPFALTDLRDIGKYVSLIISDPRTLNRMVLAYTEALTHVEIYDLLESLSGEKLERKYVPPEDIRTKISKILAETPDPAPDSPEFVKLSMYQYWYSCGVRGDNTPDNAKYLGYLTVKELYPNTKWNRLDSYIQEVLDGKAKRVYEHLDL